MFIDGYEDLELRLKRQDAFWDCEILDRPCVDISFPRKDASASFPKSNHLTLKDRWMDAEFQARQALATVENTVYMGDALPRVYPNLGPDFFPSLYGGEVIFEENTSYIKPFLRDWKDAGSLSLSKDHPYWKKMEELYAAYLELRLKRQDAFWDCEILDRPCVDISFPRKDASASVSLL